ncbi:MAG TPA: hypothetical protein VGO70_05110 [Arsenicitalea sp.]|jgi:hypothetical protein|nr:hypothetical protein [Arsenicitalea sp.]
MSTAPYQRNATSIPVTVVTGTSAPLPVVPGSALIVMTDADHDHAGAECIVCSTRGNVRALLFELQEKARLGMIPAFSAVMVDARTSSDAAAVIDGLIPGKLPAFGLRDHAVARNFHLAAVIGDDARHNSKMPA